MALVLLLLICKIKFFVPKEPFAVSGKTTMFFVLEIGAVLMGLRSVFSRYWWQLRGVLWQQRRKRGKNACNWNRADIQWQKGKGNGNSALYHYISCIALGSISWADNLLLTPASYMAAKQLSSCAPVLDQFPYCCKTVSVCSMWQSRRYFSTQICLSEFD